MSKSTILLLVGLFMLALAFGYNYFLQPFSYLNSPNQIVLDQEQTPLSSEDPANLIIENLSDRQKINQLIALPVNLDRFSDSEQTEYKTWLNSNFPGFITIFGDRVSKTQVNNLHSVINQTNIPVWLAVDHEGGSVQRLSGEGFSRLDSWQQLCQLTQEEMSLRLASSAAELSSIGIDVVFAPVVDLSKENAVLKARICTDDPQKMVDNANIYIKQFSDFGILPVIKHFPGIGETKKDLHFSFDSVDVTPIQASVYRSLLSLRSRIGVMVAHVGVNNQFPDVPCSLSSDCVGELATNFSQALIFSDGLEMKSASYSPDGKNFPLIDVVVEAVEAGDEVLVFGPSVTLDQIDQIQTALLNRYQSDEQFAQKIDADVKKVIEYKLNYEK